MSKIQDREFQPRPLPLRGPDYHIRVDRDGTLKDYEITKRGDTITLDHPFLAEDVTIRVGRDRVDISAFNRSQDIQVVKDDDRVTVYRDTGNLYTSFQQDGSRIAVRRRDPAQEVVFTRRNEDLVIDRYGFQNDVTLKVRDGVLYIDKQGTFNDVALTFDGVEVDPVTFRRDTTLDPQAYDMLQKWFETGVQMDDLVQVTQDGRVDVLDWLFV